MSQSKTCININVKFLSILNTVKNKHSKRNKSKAKTWFKGYLNVIDCVLNEFSSEKNIRHDTCTIIKE